MSFLVSMIAEGACGRVSRWIFKSTTGLWVEIKKISIRYYRESSQINMEKIDFSLSLPSFSFVRSLRFIYPHTSYIFRVYW